MDLPAGQQAPGAPVSKWQAFGQAVLTFHHRVALTAMCKCGRTVIECDVLAQARQYGLLSDTLPKRPYRLESTGY